jgi:(R,R)-butanediol dehydrogenase / meso-butanediol dehydrogenase / diacetyl reductase
VKVVAFTGPGGMELRDVPDPQPAPGEVVVKVSHCGICGSDLHEYASHGPSPRAAGMFQPVMGHEFTGTVAAIGSDVTSLKDGDPVVVHPGGTCGDCYYCNSGISNLCADQQGTGYRRSGGYAEYCAVRADQALPLPDASSLERAALTEPLGVALHAINRGGLQPGETVFIAGGGPIGLLSVIAARRKNAGLIVVSEPAESRRELALKLGADHAVDPAASASLQVRDITKGLGSDLSVEAVGIDPTLNDCLASTRRGGRIVVAGAFEQPSSVNLLTLLVQEHSLVGTFGYVDEFAQARDLITCGDVDVTPLISRTVPLADLPATFEHITNNRNDYQKVLVRPHG